MRREGEMQVSGIVHQTIDFEPCSASGSMRKADSEKLGRPSIEPNARSARKLYP